MLKISASNRYIRFFCWAWRTKPSNLNICRLFWGTLFMPVTAMTWFPLVGNVRIPRMIVPTAALLGWMMYGTLADFLPLHAYGITLLGLVVIAELISVFVDPIYGPHILESAFVDWLDDTLRRKNVKMALSVIFFPITLVVLVVKLIFLGFDAWDARREPKPRKAHTSREPLGFWAIMRTGYRSVKERTCYIVQVVD